MIIEPYEPAVPLDSGVAGAPPALQFVAAMETVGMGTSKTAGSYILL